jgi:hypothetical protein
LHTRVQVGDFEAGAHARIEIYTDEAVSADINFYTLRHGHRTLTTRTDFGIVNGHRIYSSADRFQQFRFENYVPAFGVRGGRNSFRLSVASNNLARNFKVELFPDTGVEWTAHAPAQVRIVKARVSSTRIGRTTTARFWLKNIGGLDATNIVGSIAIVGVSARPVGAYRLLIRRLPPMATVTMEFRFIPREPGYGKVAVSGSSSSNTFADLVPIQVR